MNAHFSILESLMVGLLQRYFTEPLDEIDDLYSRSTDSVENECLPYTYYFLEKALKLLKVASIDQDELAMRAAIMDIAGQLQLNIFYGFADDIRLVLGQPGWPALGEAERAEIRQLALPLDAIPDTSPPQQGLLNRIKFAALEYLQLKGDRSLPPYSPKTPIDLDLDATFSAELSRVDQHIYALQLAIQADDLSRTQKQLLILYQCLFRIALAFNRAVEDMWHVVRLKAWPEFTEDYRIPKEYEYYPKIYIPTETIIAQLDIGLGSWPPVKHT